jgi:sterol 3beta-glucosyltransferase
MAPLPAGHSRTLSPDAQKRLGKVLRRRRRREEPADLPEPLKDSDESSAEDELPSQGPPMFMNMNQSIFGLIAAAGSRIDFNDRFDEGSSSDEDEAATDDKQEHEQENLAHSTILTPPDKDKEKKSGHRKKLSGSKLLQSLPNLPSKLKVKAKRQSSRLSAPVETTDEDNELTPPAIKLTRAKTDRQPSVMSRMLEGRAEMSSRPSFDLDIKGEATERSSISDDVTPLARRLMEIFEFDEPEQVIEGKPRHGVMQGGRQC